MVQTDSQTYFYITAKTIHEQRQATQHSGYSKLAEMCHNLTVSRQPVTTKRRKRRRTSTRSAVKPLAPDWLWTEDRQIRQTAFAEIEALAGRVFTLDAAANDAGDNAMCAQFCSPANSFLDAEHTGHIWINPPFTQLPSFMQHYLHCKQLNPSSTSACILIPGYLLQELKPMLTNMRLLKRFTKGTSLFTTPTKSGARVAMPGTHWPVYIYTDVAADVTDITVNGTPLHRLRNAVGMTEELTLPHGVLPNILLCCLKGLQPTQRA